MIDDETKQCTQCKEFKARSEFGLKTAAKDGLQTWCKKCLSDYYAEHKEHRKEQRDPDRANANSLKWIRANPEKHNTISLAWQKANPEKHCAKQHRRRALKLNASGTHTIEDIKALYDSQGGRCAYGDHDISHGYHVDHVVPLSRGGSNGPENLALACARCNTSKGDKLLSEWRRA